MNFVPSSEHLLTAVEAIYGAAPDPAKWPAALAAIADCFGDVGALLIWAKDDGSFGTIVSNSLENEQRDYEAGGWSARDIRAQRGVERGYFFNGEAFTDRHLCSEDEIGSHPCYSEFLARHDLGFLGCIAVSPDPHTGVVLSIQRNAKAKGPFSEPELDLIRRIGPHIEKSLRLSIRLLDAELANVGFGDALARIGMAVFALDSLGRVVFQNPAASRLIGDGIEINRQMLHIGTGSTRAQIDSAIAGLVNGSSIMLIENQRPIMVDRPSSGRPYVVYFLPIAEPTDVPDHFLTRTRALVLVIEPKLGEPADAALVRDVLGLTLGEARVAAMVGSGLAPREAALRLGISEDTVRNVLKKVFTKVGVSRQGELAALLTRLILH